MMSWMSSSSASLVSKEFHGGSLQGVKVFNILGTQKMFGLEAVVRSAHDPSGSSEEINLQGPCEA